jgi:hypothetical protein
LRGAEARRPIESLLPFARERKKPGRQTVAEADLILGSRPRS